MTHFHFLGIQVDLTANPRGISLHCPICHFHGNLPPTRFTVTLDASGRPTIPQPIRCPNPNCGWLCKVTKGLADPIDDPQGPQPEESRISIKLPGRGRGRRRGGRRGPPR